MKIHENQEFNAVDFTLSNQSSQEFIECIFVNCDFSKADLSEATFMECEFRSCNLALAKLKNTGLKNCSFQDCKMMGLDFNSCNDFLFAVNFIRCQLDYSTFFQKKMRRTIFSECSLKEVDFGEALLAESSFKDCDLAGASFVDTNLEKADFRTAKNVTLDPEQNKLKKARFSSDGLIGLLGKYDLVVE